MTQTLAANHADASDLFESRRLVALDLSLAFHSSEAPGLNPSVIIATAATFEDYLSTGAPK